MRLALLGIDAAAIELARAAARGGHALTCLADVDPSAPPVHELLALIPTAQLLADWETLLTGELADAVVVAAGDVEQSSERLRRLAQAGVAALLTGPLGESPLVYYELEAIAAESRTALAAYLPQRAQPALAPLAAWVEAADSPLGPVEQCILERQMHQRRRGDVLQAFARDAGTIAAVLGRIVRVGTLPAADEGATFAALTVQMTDARGRPIRWSVRPCDAGPVAHLTLIGSLGSAVLAMPGEGPWTLRLNGGGTSKVETPAGPDSAAVALDELAAAIAAHRPAPSWQTATQALELVEAVARSARTGRPVEFRPDVQSERGNFKGVMSAVGCSLLLGGLGLVAVLAILGEAVGQVFGRVAFAGLLAVLALFLLAQLLGRLAEPAARSPSGTEEPP